MSVNRSILAVMAIILFVSVSPAAGQSVTPSFQFWSYKGQAGTEVNFYAERPVGSDKKFSVMAWGQKDPGWAQVYAGPTLNVSSWSSVSFCVGIEQDDRPLRLASLLWLGGRGNDSLLIVEHGGSGIWYKYTYARAVTEKVSLGVFSQRYFGTGPLLQVGIGKTKLKVWSAPLTYDVEDHTIKNMTGLAYKF